MFNKTSYSIASSIFHSNCAIDFLKLTSFSSSNLLEFLDVLNFRCYISIRVFSIVLFVFNDCAPYFVCVCVCSIKFISYIKKEEARYIAAQGYDLMWLYYYLSTFILV